MSHSRALTFSVHPDNDAIDIFVNVMRDKMALSRAKGRDGWHNECWAKTGK